MNLILWVKKFFAINIFKIIFSDIIQNDCIEFLNMKVENISCHVSIDFYKLVIHVSKK